MIACGRGLCLASKPVSRPIKILEDFIFLRRGFQTCDAAARIPHPRQAKKARSTGEGGREGAEMGRADEGEKEERCSLGMIILRGRQCIQGGEVKSNI